VFSWKRKGESHASTAPVLYKNNRTKKELLVVQKGFEKKKTKTQENKIILETKRNNSHQNKRYTIFWKQKSQQTKKPNLRHSCRRKHIQQQQSTSTTVFQTKGIKGKKNCKLYPIRFYFVFFEAALLQTNNK